MAMPPVRRRLSASAVQTAILACLLSACGYKGDLTLPPKEDAALTQPPAVPASATQSTPAPSRP